MTAPRSPSAQPLTPWIWGTLGLIPFVAGAALGALLPGDGENPGYRTGVLGWLMAYGALILSFLGGARWGLEIGRANVRARVIGLSMAPTLAGFFLLTLGQGLLTPFWRFAGLAIAFIVQWAWDMSSPDVPAWYPRLRSVLTAGAVLALGVGAFQSF